MAENKDQILSKSEDVYDPPKRVLERIRVSEEVYEKMYQESIKDPEKFWADIATDELEFFEEWTQVREWNYPNYKWFLNAKLNITHNCLDRHVNNGIGDRLAYIYTNENREERKITYAELKDQVVRFANALRSLGIQKGDVVMTYMPLTIEQIVAMLACARIGAIHSVVYAGFSAAALRLRTEDANAKAVITSAWTQRRGKKIPLRSVTEEAVQGLDSVQHVIIDRRGDNEALKPGQSDFHELLNAASAEDSPEIMDAEDPLFILYTSGTTGKPKGVLHTTAGYNLYTHFTTKISFDLDENQDIFWCTADTGWITGHSYIVYGPLSVGVTSLIVEGAPDYPDPGAWWQLVEQYKVNVFYTAPTAVRLWMKYGDEWPKKYDLNSLRVLGSVGEPINPEAWEWYYEHIGGKNAALIDTWWQTETGGHILLSLPGCKQKPGKAGRPFFGIQADVVDKHGKSVPPNHVGFLIIKEPWPSALRTCYGEPERFNNYWETMEGVYYPGDFATKDADGYIMILGRTDDVLNVSGHRIGTAEVESALVAHEAIAEAAVIGKPHAIKGESIKAFVIKMADAELHDGLIQDIKATVRKELGGLAVPDEIDFVEKLPKTRSGKIMRRVLKAQEMGTEVGDISTLED